MQVATQLAIFLENKPGTLAKLCRTLAKAEVNIYAITTSDTIDHSVIRLVVDEPKRALRILEQHSVLVVENEVLMLEGNNRPGSLAQIAEKLGEAKINIEYAYCATSPHSPHGLLILRPHNVAKALKVLNKKA